MHWVNKRGVLCGDKPTKHPTFMAESAFPAIFQGHDL